MDIQALAEGARILKRSLRRKITRPYRGDAEQICHQIIADCWNGEYFQTSAGHFSGFYIRDFAWVCASLIDLGHGRRVKTTLAYALEQYAKDGRITTTLTPNGKTTDIHDIGPDSLAMLLRSLRIAKAHALVKTHKGFLEQEAQRYFHHCFDPNLGLVRRSRYFSSIRDVYARDSACYDNWMIAIIAEDLEHFRLKNPWKGYNLRKAIEKNFWTGTFYAEDLSTREFSADANIFPFFWKILDDKKKLDHIITHIKKNMLDSPLPLRYATHREKRRELLVGRVVPDYEGTPPWAHLGMIYLDVLSRCQHREAKAHLRNYKQKIEKHKTFPELYDHKGRLFSTLFYFTDEAMIWAAIYLSCLQNMKKK